MTRIELAEAIASKLIAHLPSSYADAEISIEEVMKANLKLTGISVQKQGKTMALVAYVDDVYNEVVSGQMDVDGAARAIAGMIVDADSRCFDFDPSILDNWEAVRGSIEYSLANKSKNRDFLRDKPFRQMLDLAATYRINLKDIAHRPGAYITIPNDLLETWMTTAGISQKELDKAAEKNLCSEGVVVSPLSDALKTNGFIGADAFTALPLYVLTTMDRYNGSKALLSPKVMRRISDEVFRRSYTIVPLSTREIILAPELAGQKDFMG